MRALQVEFSGNGVCADFHQRGVFIGPRESSTDLAEAVTCQVVANRPSHVAVRLGGTASTAFCTALAFLFSCRHMSTKLQAELT
jgi:hypothetical protein